MPRKKRKKKQAYFIISDPVVTELEPFDIIFQDSKE